jgi:hypothetical protein
MNSVSRNDSLVERQPRFRTVPGDEIIDGTPIAPLGFRRPETDQHSRLGMLQVGKTELGSPAV